jgi:MFS family permease
MVAQQLTGINCIAFLSATLLQDRHASEHSGAWVGVGLGLCNFIFGLPAFFYTDKIGRATLLLLGFPWMFLWMLILSISFITGEEDGSTRPVLFGVFGILFMAAYSPSAGTSPFAISAEVFPLVIREVGHSLAVAANFFLLGVILLVFPIMTQAMGGYKGSLGLFAGLNIVAFILCFLFVPETKGRSLEELQFTFDLPTRLHIRYRIRYITQWLAKRFALPITDKIGIYKEDKVKKPLKEFKSRAPFFRWGRAEAEKVRKRAEKTNEEDKPELLFSPWGIAKIFGALFETGDTRWDQ